MKKIKESPFANTYGRLELFQDDQLVKFLVMEDCFGPSIFGPLTDEQVNAFHVLCEVGVA